jgi:hypothetical protein
MNHKEHQDMDHEEHQGHDVKRQTKKILRGLGVVVV